VVSKLRGFSATAQQQPAWPDVDEVSDVRGQLATQPQLVTSGDVEQLRRDLAQVARGRARVIQVGDCAEDPAESDADHVARKAGLIETLAGVMKMVSRAPVIGVGRMAGQFAKPRSQPTQQVGDTEIPAYRGPMVNDPAASADARRPDPHRLLHCYDAARETMDHLGWPSWADGLASDRRVWTSHEALLLDYELPMLRRDDAGDLLLTSTHWPWIGERTRQLDGPHVALLADVVNPVACKLGPLATAEEVLGLCDRLDPAREPGRLTLISRIGADEVPATLPPLAEAVQRAGHPVVWLCDPMHANTVTSPDGHKTRFVETIIREVQAFREAVESAGGVAGGLHLETTADQVTECVDDESCLARVGDRYTSLCDPRLNPGQAMSVVSAWKK
jgi:3-deoxy-7-phosphoheptulonate synthase